MAKAVFRFREADRNIFEAIRDKTKKVETRAATPKFAGLKKGDWVVLVCGQDKLEKQIKKVKIFKSLSFLLQEYSFKDINPFALSVDDLEKMYDSFPGYQEKIGKYGLIALEFE